MEENVRMCPFSKTNCRNCAVYRGRHNHTLCKGADQLSEPRVVEPIDEADWQEMLKEALQPASREAQETLLSESEVTVATGDGRGEGKYNIRLVVLDRETGDRRISTVSEAAGWDWGNRQKVRSIGPWHIYSFGRLLSILSDKVEAGSKEVELVEAPFYMGC